MIDLLIASHLAFAVPQLPPVSPVFAETTIARSYGGGRSFSSSPSFGSSRFSLPRQTIDRFSPARSSSGSIVINRQRPSNSSLGFESKPIKNSTGATMVTKQKSTSVLTPSPASKPTIASPSITKPRNTISPSPRIRTQTTYVPSPVYVDRGPDLFTNLLLWDALSNRRNNPTPVLVTQPSDNSDTKPVTITKTVDRYNPVREFAVFALGSGITVLGLKKFAKF